MQNGFAYCDRNATNPISGVAMVSQCDQGYCFWGRNGVALRPIFQMCPPRVWHMLNFEFLALFQPLDVKSMAKMSGWDRATCLVRGRAQGTKKRDLERNFERHSWRQEEEEDSYHHQQPPLILEQETCVWIFSQLFSLFLACFSCIIVELLFMLCWTWIVVAKLIWIQGWCSSPLKCHELLVY